MTTRSDILLSYPFQQFSPAAPLTCSLASSFTHSTGTTADPTPLVSACPGDSVPTHLRAAQKHHIPSSVKGAPAHLRQVIRKRQNSESAKRSRQRRKEAARRFYQRFDQQCQRISALEKRVTQLADLVRQRQKMENGEVESVDEHQQDTYNHNPSHDEKHVLAIPQERPGASTGSLDIIDQPIQAPHPPDLSGDGAVAFQEDLEALLDSCMQAQYCVDDSISFETPYS